MTDCIDRHIYLQRLITRRDNGAVKIITGPRQCGKSWLLEKNYRDYLIADGVPKEDIIFVSFDKDEEMYEKDLRSPRILKQYLYSRITDKDRNYYVVLDEIQMSKRAFSK